MVLKPKMTVRSWYGSSVPIPGFRSYRFPGFVASCIGIVRSIFHKQSGKKIYVTFLNNVETAAADTANLNIKINAKFLLGEVPILGIRGLPADETISLILGIIVHEAAHFAYSPPTLEEVVDYVKKNTVCAYNRNVALALGNIVEDIFIEAQIDRDVPSLTWMLNCMNDLFSEKKSLSEDIGNCAGIEEPPALPQQLTAILNLLIQAKLHESVEGRVSDYISHLFNLTRSAVEPSTIQERFELTLKIYDALMQRFPESECGEEGEEESLEEALKEILKSAKGMNGDYEEGSRKQKTLMQTMKEAGETATRVAHSVDTALHNMKDCEVSMVSDANHLSPDPAIIVEEVLASYNPAPIDDRYLELAQLARQRATVNRPYGEQRSRGHSIRNLYRIATDNKIFSQPMPVNLYKPMQVVILVDASGSMTGNSIPKGGIYISRLQAAAEAALGAAYGLVQGQCEVAVYAHTADILEMKETRVYRLKGFGEPIGCLPERMGGLLQYGNPTQNRDGYAIAHVGKRFTSSTRKRLLIVISDGQPHAGGYSGQAAREHTRGEVEKLRRERVDVLSISITREAKDANNFIYGENNNIFNDDPNIIEQVVQNLIL